MKAIIYILTAFFVMNFTLLSAGNPKIIILQVNGSTFRISYYDDYSNLAPVTPKEAFFNDSEPRPLSEINRLAPITPKEATFEEINAESGTITMNPLILKKISPVTPKEAEFEETFSESINENIVLTPTTPLAASFEE